MSIAPLPKYKKQTKITINTSNKNIVFQPFKSLKTILKEKLLYDHICSIHHCNYFKYCTKCKKDICCQCETESHTNHKTINYENILPDLNEINIIKNGLKEYEKNYYEFINIINKWKKDFDKMLNDYQKQMSNIIEYINKFNNEKKNFNSIYKYRSVFSLILDSNNQKDEKNNKIVELMENILKEKETKIDKDNDNYIQKIKKDYKCFLSHNKLKEIVNNLDKETFSNKIQKIINIIEHKNENENKNSNTKVDLDDKTPNLNAYKNNNGSSYTKNNTSASTFGKNYYKISTNDNNKAIGQNTKENEMFKINPYTYRNQRENICKEKKNHSKSTNDIIIQTQNNNIINDNFSVYEKKKIREKSNEYTKPSFNDNFETITNINNINNNGYKENKKINKNILQETINKIKIKPNQNIYDNYINNNCCQKIIKRNKRNNLLPNKTHNLVNKKSLLYDYKGFDINNKDSGADLLNNSSYIIEGIKYYSNSLRSNSLEYRPYKHKYFSNLGKLYMNNASSSNSLDNKIKNRNSTLEKNNTYNDFNMMTLNEKTYSTINNTLPNSNRNYYSRNQNKSIDNSLAGYVKHKMNNSVINVNNNNNNFNNSLYKNYTHNSINVDVNKKNINHRLIFSHIHNNNSRKNKKIYVHKKYTPIDDLKNLSSIDSISSSFASQMGTNSNNNNNKPIKENNISKNDNKYLNTNTTINNNIHINGNKPLFIGLELGNSQCKIGVINKDNNFELFNYNNNYSIPTVISFIENNLSGEIDIKIGEEAEKLKISNVSQTIFNIIKLIGKNTNEIVGRKDLWPFNIYNDEKTNKPYIKINYNNQKKFINYNFEDILSIFLQKLFQIFFNRIIIDKSNEQKDKNINKPLDINIVISIPNYYNYLQRKIIEKIFITKLFPKTEVIKNNKKFLNPNIYGKYNMQLNKIQIENVSNLASFCILEKEKINNKNISLNYLVLYIEGGSINISIVNINNKNNKNLIEVKAINGDEFGEEDFLDNFICTCLSDFKDKIRKSCLTYPLALAKLRKSLNIVKKCFDTDDILQTELNINKLYDTVDLKMIINKKDYIKSCMGLFRKIIFLIKETILNSKIEIKDINDIILLGNITQNIKLKNMISELFKDNNKIIYNKLIKKKKENDNEINNYIIKGAIMQCFNNNMTIPKYKLINITHSSFGIESLNGLMDIVIEKGSNIPIKYNKYIKIKKPDINQNNLVNINIYEGENKIVKNNRLISSNYIDIQNFRYEKKDGKSIEILFQFFIDSNNNLSVYILDKNSYRKKFECPIDFN